MTATAPQTQDEAFLDEENAWADVEIAFYEDDAAIEAQARRVEEDAVAFGLSVEEAFRAMARAMAEQVALSEGRDVEHQANKVERDARSFAQSVQNYCLGIRDRAGDTDFTDDAQALEDETQAYENYVEKESKQKQGYDQGQENQDIAEDDGTDDCSDMLEEDEIDVTEEIIEETIIEEDRPQPRHEGFVERVEEKVEEFIEKAIERPKPSRRKTTASKTTKTKKGRKAGKG